jgi:hypothetical protein
MLFAGLLSVNSLPDSCEVKRCDNHISGTILCDVHLAIPTSKQHNGNPAFHCFGNRALVFDGLLPAAGAAASDLRVFCLALVDPRAWNDPSPKSVYVAKGCSELTRDEAPSRVVLAAVDVTAKALKLRVE